MNNKLTKEEVQLVLSEAPAERKFFCADGKVFSSIEQLQHALYNMSPNTFRYHVNQQKNDFSNWIKYVFRDELLAQDIQKQKSKEAIAKRIKTRLQELKQIAK